jgi:hypothetical protein
MAEKEKKESHKGKGANGFHTTTTRHFDDGSKHMKHEHHDPEKNVEHAVPDHDAMMDSMQQNLAPQGQPAEGQGEEAEAAGAAGAGQAV